MTQSLYERLGASDGIRKIADVLVDNHAANPATAPRFADSDLDQVKKLASDFFITGSGGPQVYEGKDLPAAHRNMNINATEFLAVLDDAMDALDKNNIGQREKEEVLFILYSLKNDVLHL